MAHSCPILWRIAFSWSDPPFPGSYPHNHPLIDREYFSKWLFLYKIWRCTGDCLSTLVPQLVIFWRVCSENLCLEMIHWTKAQRAYLSAVFLPSPVAYLVQGTIQRVNFLLFLFVSLGPSGTSLRSEMLGGGRDMRGGPQGSLHRAHVIVVIKAEQAALRDRRAMKIWGSHVMPCFERLCGNLPEYIKYGKGI